MNISRRIKIVEHNVQSKIERAQKIQSTSMPEILEKIAQSDCWGRELHTGDLRRLGQTLSTLAKEIYDDTETLQFLHIAEKLVTDFSIDSLRNLKYRFESLNELDIITLCDILDENNISYEMYNLEKKIPLTMHVNSKYVDNNLLTINVHSRH